MNQNGYFQLKIYIKKVKDLEDIHYLLSKVLLINFEALNGKIHSARKFTKEQNLASKLPAASLLGN